MSYNFKDKVVLVTGASRGIGKAIAAAYAKLGARVIANYNKNREEALVLVKELNSNGYSIEIIQADVSKSKEVEKMVDEILKKHGHIDILINNAGIRKDGFLAMMSEDDWDDVINVNLKSVFNVTKWVSRAMMFERKGKIINISSLSAFKGLAGQTNYAASKGGIISFTRAAATELSHFGIQVNAVAPGLVDTEMIKDMDKRAFQELIQKIPLGKIGTAQDVVGGVLFLASDRSDYITGQTILIDGGLGI